MSEWHIRFGTAGTSDSFEAKGYKSSLDIPAYTAEMGLDAFEYQCGHGVRLGVDKAGKMAADAAERGILFSVHAPYYISMSSLEEEKRLGSVRYLLQSAEVCRALGGRRIIFHSGSCGKQSREAALEKALDTMRRAVEALDEAGYGDMTLPGDHGQARPAGYAGRSIGPLRGGQAHHALHRLRPPERPDLGRHPVQGRLRRHPRPDG
ncbi:MAG: TIM barrel protein [Faecalibacterium prausnitzii]